jgi:hypothetical protein
MTARPDTTEAAPHYFLYIDKVPGEDACAVMEAQLEEALNLFAGISEEASLHRYARINGVSASC